MYNISVTKGQASATNVWVTNTIYHKYYFNNDSNHHLFVYWTAQIKDSRDGCCNTYCPGFVQIDTKYHPGSFLTTGNNYNVNQYPLDEIPIMIFQEELSGHWWVMLSNQLKFVGYWTKDLVDIDGASNVGWGAVTNPGTTGVNPSMGSGHKPDDVYNHAACFRDMKYLKKELEPQIPANTELETFVDPCYATDDLHYSGSPYSILGL
ncbi:uncharacterized protein LOC112018081 [Quercus suber]|uniref:uncharacterized protein LOC112018081 n=1 Tax=Quercus suber TaxID=58331 RepID=UPI0032DE47A6